MLQVQNLEVVYDDVMLVLRGVSLEVSRRARSLPCSARTGPGRPRCCERSCGLLDVHDGEITKGSITWTASRSDGRPAGDRAPRRLAGDGGPADFRGADGRGEPAARGAHQPARSGALGSSARSRCSRCWPSDARRRAGYLSGGEQQMLAMGRALMANPRYLLLDEPSLGLAPRLVEQIRDLIVEINRQGTAVLLVEQNATMALSIAVARLRDGDRQGRAGQAGRRAARRRGCAGVLPGPASRRRQSRSFRDVKHYKRRKRWLS